VTKRVEVGGPGVRADQTLRSSAHDAEFIQRQGSLTQGGRRTRRSKGDETSRRWNSVGNKREESKWERNRLVWKEREWLGIYSNVEQPLGCRLRRVNGRQDRIPKHSRP
jgi:hypothetical protein